MDERQHYLYYGDGLQTQHTRWQTFAGDEPQPGDEIRPYSRLQLLTTDTAFCQAVERALASDGESRASMLGRTIPRTSAM